LINNNLEGETPLDYIKKYRDDNLFQHFSKMI